MPILNIFPKQNNIKSDYLYIYHSFVFNDWIPFIFNIIILLLKKNYPHQQPYFPCLNPNHNPKFPKLVWDVLYPYMNILVTLNILRFFTIYINSEES